MFDFETLYRKYATQDLLRIVQQPSLYQSAAVEAAQRVLREREVTAEQYAAIADVLEQEQVSAAAPGPLEKAQAKLVGFIQYLFTPSHVFDPRKWVYWLAIALSVQVFLSIPNCINYVRSLFSCRGCPFDLLAWSLTLFWLVEPVMIVLLLLTKRSGWMLAVFYEAYQVASGAGNIFLNWQFIENFWLWQTIWLAIFGAMLHLLRSDGVTSLFNVSRNLWVRLTIAGVVVWLLTIIAVELQA